LLRIRQSLGITRPRHIEPEHLSPNLVRGHRCAQTIRHTNFYPLWSGSICLGHVPSPEVRSLVAGKRNSWASLSPVPIASSVDCIESLHDGNRLHGYRHPVWTFVPQHPVLGLISSASPSNRREDSLTDCPRLGGIYDIIISLRE